jgi:hypothetical protein
MANVEPFNVVKIYEPTSNATFPNQYIALVGGQSRAIHVFETSTLSPANAVFTNINPPSAETLVDKKIYLRARVNMKFTGTSTDGIVLRKGRDGLRYMPIHSIINTARCTLNTQAIACDIFNTIHPRSNYWSTEVDQLSRTSSCSAIKDNCQDYADMFGTINNPLAGLGDSGLTSGHGRGVIHELEVVSNSGGQAEINFTITEPIVLAPFYDDSNNAGSPLWNITTITFDFQFVSNLNRMWCHDDAGGTIITDMTTTINTMSLLMTTITPPVSLTPLPPICTTTYNVFNVVGKNTGPAFAPNEEREVFTDSLQWNYVPHSVLIFAKVDNNSLLSWTTDGTYSPMTITAPDCYCEITNVSIDYMNDQNLLSNMRKEQLYQMCVGNGYNRDYQQFNGRVNAGSDFTETVGLNGSVVRLIFGKDIAGKGIIPGLNERSNFKLRVRIRNVNQTKSLNITLYTVAIEEGVIQIIPGDARIDQAPIKRVEDVDVAPVANIPYEKYRQMFGGGFLDTLKNIGATALQMAPGLLSMVPHPAAQVAAQVGKSIGLGGRKTRGGQLVDTSGGSILAAGGQRLTVSELRKLKQIR